MKVDVSSPGPLDTRNGSYSRKSKPLNTKLTEESSREYFWGCTLTKEKPSFTWSHLEEDNDADYLEHTLFLKHATLGPSAVKDERNIVSVETKAYNEEEIKQPIVNLTCGQKDMIMLDLVFPFEVPVTFRLIEGSGPVHLTANELIEVPAESEDELNETGTETELTEETEEDEEEVVEEEEQEEEQQEGDEDEECLVKKRKGSLKCSRAKRGKVSATTEEEESMEEGTNGTSENSDEIDEEDSEEPSGEDEVETYHLQPCEILIKAVKKRKAKKTTGMKAKKVTPKVTPRRGRKSRS